MRPPSLLTPAACSQPSLRSQRARCLCLARKGLESSLAVSLRRATGLTPFSPQSEPAARPPCPPAPPFPTPPTCRPPADSRHRPSLKRRGAAGSAPRQMLVSLPAGEHPAGTAPSCGVPGWGRGASLPESGWRLRVHASPGCSALSPVSHSHQPWSRLTSRSAGSGS